MSDAPTVVGVDIGTGSARALAIDRDGTVLARSRAPFPGSASWPAGRADPAGWRTGLAEALHGLGVARPTALAIGSQSPTTVPRSGGLALTVRHPAGVTGTPEEQHAAQRAALCEEAGPATQVAQLWDWLLHALGAPWRQTRWPEDPTLEGYGDRAPTGAVVGEATGEWGVPPGTLLVGGAQDAYLAFWAGGADQPGRGVDPGGRTGGLAVAVERGTRPEGMYALASAAAGLELVGGPVAAHGLMLDWLAGVTRHEPAFLIELAASVPPGSRGVTVVPYLEGERAPRWNRDLRAEIAGLSSEHGVPELARAVLEGTAYGLAHLAAGLRGAGVAIDRVTCGGSPARSRTWCEIKAAVLGVPVAVPDEPDLAAYGAALAAGAGAGWWEAPGAGAPGSWPKPRATLVEPAEDAAYEDGYDRFIALGDAAVARIRDHAAQGGSTWQTASTR